MIGSVKTERGEKMIEKIEYYSSGVERGNAVLWVRHSDLVDLVDKINELIDIINEMAHKSLQENVLISREEAIKAVCFAACGHKPCFAPSSYCRYALSIYNLPAIDAVEVVRCKD